MNTTKTILLLGAVAFMPAAAQDATHSVIETVTVTGEKIADADKGQTPLIETPQNIQIVSGELLIDQDVTTLDEALRNVAGTMGGGYYQSWDYFRIRGFDASGYIYQDGLKKDSGVNLSVELFGIERVEIVKGPASSLYGEGSLGGLVNLASKLPTDRSFLDLGLSYGSFASYEANADANAVLSDAVSVRLPITFRHSGVFTDHVPGNNRLSLAPSLRWQIDDATTLTLLGSYQHDNMNFNFPLTKVGLIEPSAHGTYDRDLFTGEPGRSNKGKNDREEIGYQFEHRFNSVFSFQSRTRYAWNNQNWDKIFYTSYLDSDQRTLYRYPYTYEAYWTDFSADESLSARFATGPVEHTLVIGADHFIYNSSSTSWQIDYSDPASYLPLDLYDPVYGLPMPAMNDVSTNMEKTDDTGFYIQDHAKWGKLTLTVALRYDFTSYANSWDGDLAPHDNEAFVPRFGLTYEFLPGNVVFASYSQSFKPQSGVTYRGDEIEPEAGTQWEAGVKSNLWDGKVSLTASLFHLTRSHVASSDSAHYGFMIETGKVRSQGFEFDGKATPLPGWDIIATYAYTDVAITQSSDYPVGARLQGVPMNSMGLWSKYAFEGALDGFSASGGIYHYSSMAADMPNSFRLPAYTLVNAALAYDFGPAELQLTVKNLTDEAYFSGAYNEVYVQPGNPRTIGLDLRVHL